MSALANSLLGAGRVERLACWLADRGVLRFRIEEALKREQLRTAVLSRSARASDDV
jgi:hypothetical protein